MSKVQEFDKKRFIIEECMMFSFNAGVQTRNKSFPVYKKMALIDHYINKELRSQPDNTSNLKFAIFEFLDQYLLEIKKNGVNENFHLLKIQELAKTLTKNFMPILHEEKFRIGISQKIINLFLKYMWSINEIPEPCHCPIDGIVKSQIQKKIGKISLPDWTSMDNIIDYQSYINTIKQIAAKDNLSIAQWEFLNWGRR